MDSLLVVDQSETFLGLVTLKGIKLENRSTPVQQVMIREVPSVSENENLITILHRMNEYKTGYLPVVNDTGQLVGLITRSSLLSVLGGQLIDMEVDF